VEPAETGGEGEGEEGEEEKIDLSKTLIRTHKEILSEKLHPPVQEEADLAASHASGWSQREIQKQKEEEEL